MSALVRLVHSAMAAQCPVPESGHGWAIYGRAPYCHTVAPARFENLNRKGEPERHGHAGRNLIPLLQCVSPLLAQSRHTEANSRCPLSGVKRTRLWHGAASAFDLVCVKTHTFAKCRKNNSSSRHR